MKTVKSKLSVFLAVLLACLVLVPAQAAGPLDAEKTTDLTVHLQYNGSPVAGAAFDVYLVADRTDYSVFQPLEPFKQPYLEKVDGVTITTEMWQGLANTLKAYVADRSNGISPSATGITDENGDLTVSGLKNGLYLVVGQDYRPTSRERYTSTPFLIALPGLDSESNTWQYAVTANPKADYTKTKKPSNPPDNPPDNPPAEPETVSRKVLKIWEDEGSENLRPASIEVRLLKDGDVYDTVTLTAENNWRYEWEGLSDEYDWMVEEVVLDDSLIDTYLPLTDWEGITATVTNYAMTEFEEPPTPLDEGPPLDDDVIIEIPDEPTPLDAASSPPTPNTVTTPNERLPQTGLLWWPVPILLSAGLLCVIIGVVRRRGDECD